MPGYVLDGVGRLELPRRPLAVTVDATGATVEVWAVGPDGAESRQVIHPRPGLMILPRVDAEIVVVARPAGQEEFPQGTILYATIGVDSDRDPDPERAELTPIDVSGLYSVELASVAPAGERVAVTARKTAVDVVLGELAARARSAARGVLRVDRLPEARRLRIELDVDTTISMAPRIEDHSIRAVAEVVAGIAAVVGTGEAVQVNLVGRSVTTLADCELRDLGDRVQTALDSVSLGVGFRSAALDRTSCADRTLVVSVTDAVPADRVDDAGEESNVRRHHVVLSTTLTEPVAGVTVVTPPSAGGEAAEPALAEALPADPARLRRMVASVLSDSAAVRDSEGVLR